MVSFKPHHTFGIDVKAQSLKTIESEESLLNFLKENSAANPISLILGGGSNILPTQDIQGTVLKIAIAGKEITEESHESVTLKIGAGENWHQTVLWAIQNDFGGIENLSLIPGNCGTAPIQNIGAYGVELKDVLVRCHGIQISTLEKKTFSNQECQFGYRDSLFKRTLKDDFIITHIEIKLSKPGHHQIKTEYGDIQKQLAENRVTQPTIQEVSKAIISIRKRKLPDPALIGNAGSFFKNPVIKKEAFEILKKKFEDLPGYPTSDESVKVPAGWLIEKAGWKGFREKNFGVNPNQALVLVNFGGAQGKDIAQLSERIQSDIRQKFNITLTPEVNIL